MWQKIKNIFHFFQALLANIIYRFPSHQINVIGITGTDGKTSTTHLIYHLLKENSLPASMISTVYAKIANKEYETGLHVTTPSPFVIQKFISQAIKNEQKYFILETTSHALDQNRVFGIKYQIGIITNITHEHLDYHKDFNSYIKAKAKLLNQSKLAIVNTQLPIYKKIKQYIVNKNLKIFNYYQNRQRLINQSFPLAFLDSYMIAYTVGRLLNLPHRQIIKAMKTFKLPAGRLDIVHKEKFLVIIDFAHTPNAFQVILPFVRKKYLKDNNRLIHVFGSAGLRDRSKRPLMGSVSSRYADLIVITEEDYRTENLNQICQQIASGINKEKFRLKTPNQITKSDSHIYTIITNRFRAIRFAIKQANDGDVILLTGKGHEKSLARGKREYPWNEKKAVLTILKENQYL